MFPHDDPEHISGSEEIALYIGLRYPRTDEEMADFRPEEFGPDTFEELDFSDGR